MASVLKVQKSLVTKRVNMITKWLKDNENLLSTPPNPEVHGSKAVAGVIKVCKENLELVEASLRQLAQANEKLRNRSPEDDLQFDIYEELAENAIIKLHEFEMELTRIQEETNTNDEAANNHNQATQLIQASIIPPSRLPEIPIPRFSGKRWEWENYWTLFLANVHQQELTDLQKFNYLLSSLSGEARESIARFQVTAANYKRAVDHLQRRYGRREGVILELHRSLNFCTARGPRTGDQRQLFEKLSAIAAQLQSQGEILDNYLTVQTFLNKFHKRIQIAATKRCIGDEVQPAQVEEAVQREQDNEWILELWLNAIDSIITQEERLQDILAEPSTPHTPQRAQSGQSGESTPQWAQKREQTAITCECCNRRGHRWSNCPQLPTPVTRKNFLTQSNRCLNCGSNTHKVIACKSGNCRKCQQRHHTATCFKEPKSETSLPKQDRPSQHQPANNAPSHTPKARPTISSRQHIVTVRSPSPEQEDHNDAIVLQMNKRPRDVHSKVILLVGMARVLDSAKNLREAIVLLDTGSELSFIQEDFAQELGLSAAEKTSLMINTFANKTPLTKSYDVSTLQLQDMEGNRHELRLFRSKYITGVVEQADLDQADSDFIHQQGIALSIQPTKLNIQPQILLGCDYLWNLMMPIGRLVMPSGLQLIPTKLGYIISGRQAKETRAPAKTLSVMNCEEEKETWDRYWSLESSGTNEFTGSTRTEQQRINDQVLKDFCETIERRDDGYYVRLPWKTDSPPLPDNKAIAFKRLHKVLEMFADKKETLSQYDSIFKEQLEKGIIEEVPQDVTTEGNIIHYLPHQAVITPAKETTKMRIVFDASAHYRDKPCLNDVLHQGPLQLPDLVSILLRFRAHNIAIISDVEKAFLQVRLQERDRDATRCLWLRDISLPPVPNNIVTYRFTRVTFGLNTSPFLLGATIVFHLDHNISDKDQANEIKENLYVDNLIVGAKTVSEAIRKYHLSKNIFKGLNMNLREFLSNSDDFNNAIDSKDRTKTSSPKVLGILWNSGKDKLILQGTMTTSKVTTKRTVSMQLASVFDPLGLMVPLLLPAKIFLQSLWKEEYGWDTPLSAQLQEQWRSISNSIATFYKEIDRKIVDYNNAPTMFVFADASQFAMATCVYLQTNTGTHLVMAKSKLPSIKTAITIPKLEMNAMTLATRVAHFVHSSLNHVVQIRKILFFTDSEIVLGWIKSPPARQTAGVLVANRLKEVTKIINDLQQQEVTCLFGHIPTSANPADCATRGLTVTSCQEHFWWNGPQLIQGDITQTSEFERMFPLTLTQEEMVEQSDHGTVVALLTREANEPTLFPLVRYGSIHKAQRVVAYVMRFIRKLVQHLSSERRDLLLNTISALQVASSKHELSGPELREAKKCIIRDHQKALVDPQRGNLQKDLNIRLDQDGLLRCYGRLKHATLPPSATTPIFVVPKSELARLIILEAHSQYHLGVAHTMAAVREFFWIPKLRQQVSKILRSCLQCQKLNNLPFRYPNMKDLPATRVRRSRPFEHIGLDYFGPLSVTNGEEVETKAYGCILTCRTTRLLHIELVENGTTEAFLNALRRFFARRGVPKSVTSDNAPTFLLGEQILFQTIQRVLQDATVESELAKREIEWIHITPYAPWQGGFYERLVKSIKYSLYKSLGKRTVSFDVLRTMLTEIETILNSRPLTYQEEKWEQQPILRPIDFLQNEIILDFPFECLNLPIEATYHTPEEEQQLVTQRRVEEALKSSVRLTENFWKIWSTQYLTSLREHHKIRMDNKRGTKEKPFEGEVVLLCDPILPRNTWKIGRIVELKPSRELIREVTVELPTKSRVRRPINKIVPLEIQGDTIPQPAEARNDSVTPRRYNLRGKKDINYAELAGLSTSTPTTH